MKRARTSTSRQMARHGVFASLLLMSLTGLVSVAYAKAGGSTAPVVRGWAIVNLMRFSYWPDAAYADKDAPTVVCARPGHVVLPEDYANAATPINGRGVILRESEDLVHLESCQVAFFCSEDMAVFRRHHAGRADHPIAYVGDTPGFAAEGGSFELILNEDNAFFRFNRPMLVECGIQLAQSLMRMGSLPGHGDGRQP